VVRSNNIKPVYYDMTTDLQAFISDESGYNPYTYQLAETRSLFEELGESPKPDEYDLDKILRLRRDHKVSAPLAIRASAVINRPNVVIPGGGDPKDIEAAEFISNLLVGDIQSPQTGLLDRFASPMLQSGTLLGYSVAELVYGRDENGRITLPDVRVRDSRSFKFGKLTDDPNIATHMGHELLWKPHSDPNAQDYVTLPAKKFFVYTYGTMQGNPYGVGLGNLLWWLVKLKRDAIKFWLIYVDKFGSPTVYGRVSDDEGYTEEDLRQIEANLLAFVGAIRRGTHGVCPRGTDIKMLEAIRSGSGNHEELISYFDKAIVELLLGSIHMGDSQGLSGAPARSDELVRQETAQSDADLFHGLLNDTIVKWLTEMNFPGAKPPSIWRDFRKKEGLDSKLQQDSTLFEQGWKLRPEALVERYGDLYEPVDSPLNSPLVPEFSEAESLARYSLLGERVSKLLSRSNYEN
jgi:hypothetical protein